MNEELTKTINEQYQVGNSIQAIARTHHIEVADVLKAIGQAEMLEVESVGDLVDSSEVDPYTTIKPFEKHRAKFTTN